MNLDAIALKGHRPLIRIICIIICLKIWNSNLLANGESLNITGLIEGDKEEMEKALREHKSAHLAVKELKQALYNKKKEKFCSLDRKQLILEKLEELKDLAKQEATLGPPCEYQDLLFYHKYFRDVEELTNFYELVLKHVFACKENESFVFYKHVPTEHLASIKTNGLDSLYGGIGGYSEQQGCANFAASDSGCMFLFQYDCTLGGQSGYVLKIAINQSTLKEIILVPFYYSRSLENPEQAEPALTTWYFIGNIPPQFIKFRSINSLGPWQTFDT